MTLNRAVPVLQVSDVGKSMKWYKDVLGFDGSAFPERAPFSFASLRRDGVEVMLQRSTPQGLQAAGGWSIYFRVGGNMLLTLADRIRAKTRLIREPARMPYCDVEFSIADPDGHELVFSEQLPDGAPVRSVQEGENSA